MNQIRERLSPSELADVGAFIHGAGGHLPDQLAADQLSPRPGFVAVLSGRPLTAYAQASAVGDRAWQIANVPESDGSVLTALVDELADQGGGAVTWWTSDERAAPIAAGLGLIPGRRLLNMGVELPLAGHREAVATRAFRPGLDDDEWLAVNAAAFAGHPEQGGWDLATLRQRQAEPWWDPQGFLIYEENGTMVGFCWTKVHSDVDPPVGEIYVIGVLPSASGRGLGEALTAAGLASLAGRGIRRGMLFVDADNLAAVRLYRRLGFSVERTEQAYTAQLEPR